MLDDFVTVSEAARLRAVTPDTIRRWCRDGWIKGARRIGPRVWMVPRAEVEAFKPPPPGPKPAEPLED